MDTKKILVKLPGQKLYDKEFRFRTFTLQDLRDLTTATETNDVARFISVINNTCDQDISELTVYDFYFVLWHQRMNSFTRHPYTVTWQCGCGRENTSEIKVSNLVITDVAEDFEDGGEQILFAEQKVHYHFERISHILDAIDQANEHQIHNRSRSEIISDLVLCSRIYYPEDKEKTVWERRSTYFNPNDEKGFSPDDIIDFSMWDQKFSYGVKENLKLTCAECNKETTMEYKIEMMEFFPQNYRTG